jgi:hypothetical protein
VGKNQDEWLFWLIGSALFANVLAFIGCNYFDQSRISWFFILASICAVTAPALQGKILIDVDEIPAREFNRLVRVTPQPIGGTTRFS